MQRTDLEDFAVLFEQGLGNVVKGQITLLLIFVLQYLMDHFLERLEQTGNVKDLLRQSCKKNGLNNSLGGELTISKLRLLNQKFKKAYNLPNTSIHSRIKTSWIENQLKAFNWILIALSALENVTISQYVSQQKTQDERLWGQLQQIFQLKALNFLKFETRRFLEQKRARNTNWSEDENGLLLRIVGEIQKNQAQKADKDEGRQGNMKDKIHWNEVARQLFEQSGEKYFRSAKHCRERWFNYIDPSKERGKWREEEDDELIQLVKKNGKRWAEISNILHRTQHNVKNRYHSLQTRGKKDIKKKPTKMTSLEEQKPQPIPIKEENQKEPLITISQLPQKSLKARDSIKVAQQLDCFQQIQQMEDFPQIVRTQDPNQSNPKNDFFLFSPFQPYSPKNLTPFMGSPSPLTFSLHNIGNFISEQRNFTEDLMARREE